MIMSIQFLLVPGMIFAIMENNIVKSGYFCWDCQNSCGENPLSICHHIRINALPRWRGGVEVI